MSLNPADAAFVKSLTSALPDGVVSLADARHLEEPRGLWQGRPGPLARPRNVEEVSAIVRACAAARVGIVPYGGGTGLVGGQVVTEGPLPLILSLERMRAIRAVYPEENVLIAEAGAVLADAQTAAANADRLFPLSLAAQGTAQIGGNLSTNAGGLNVLRYGNARALCLGLEAVLPNGEIWHGLTRLYKDNTGYDLRDLLIGAEGTLGVITAAALKLSPRPAAEAAALMAVRDPAAALQLLAMARDLVGEGVSAFELIHGQGIGFLAETGLELRIPLDEVPEWSVLIDLGLPAGGTPQQALEELFAAGFEAGLVTDGVVAQSEAQRAEIWMIRETIPEANRRIGAVSSHDIALPLGEIPDFIAQASALLTGMAPVRINCFGHLGDGNLHFNLFPLAGAERADLAPRKAELDAVIYDAVARVGGSISAEHGIGRLKTTDLMRYGDPVKLAAMRAIKTALDPQGIMNPGAVMPAVSQNE